MSPEIDTAYLREKAAWVWRETLRLHARSPESRVASSLSAVEIFTVLFHGGILAFDPKDVYAAGRDRLIVSKAHGSISLMPVLADVGYFDKAELGRICRDEALLGSIPDPSIPGYETLNGSLGHGLGVGAGVALALRAKRSPRSVFVLLGDGEFFEGSVWEGVMFAAEHKLDGLTMVVDHNKLCMLDYCKRVIDLDPLDRKLEAFGWRTSTVADGHDVGALTEALFEAKALRDGRPKAVIAHTVKGRGVPELEASRLCHVMSISRARIEELIGGGERGA